MPRHAVAPLFSDSSKNNSTQLWERALKLIPGGVNSPVRAFRAVGGTPFFVRGAHGCMITTADGEELIDYVGTWGPAILGHAPEVVIEALREAAGHGLSFGIPNPLEVTMAEMICRMVPSVEKVRMVNSGTEATMSCIRLARGFTRRDRVIKFEGCYHGHVDSLLVKAGSGGLTLGCPDSAGVPNALAALTTTLAFNDLEAVEACFKQQGESVAALILEPVPANAGLYLPHPGFLERLRALCTEYGALLIFDEVMTGFRLAPGGAQEIYGITPDLTALGKVIGGGLPVGAFGGSAVIMDHLAPNGPVYQAGTLSGNPLAMTAGITQLHIMEQRVGGLNGWDQLEERGALLEKNIREIIANKPLTFHRMGSMFCLYFNDGPVTNLEDAKKSRMEEFARFFQACLARHLYLPPSQFESSFISIAHSSEVIHRTSEIIADALKAF